MPVPSRAFVVTAAQYASATIGSRMRSVGAIGEGGICGSGRTTCSPPQSDSNPAASAARATRMTASGVEHA